VVDACISLAGQVKGKVDTLVDVSRMQKQSPEARKAFKRWSEHPKCRRHALYGLSLVAPIVAAFAVSMFGDEQKKTTKFFTSKADALAWLSKNPA
jgi:hypothetical protein